MVVYINLGVSKTVHLEDLLEAVEIPANAGGRILAVTNESGYSIGELIPDPLHFELARFDAIAFVLAEAEATESTPAGGSTTVDVSTPSTPGVGSNLIASFVLVISAILLVFAN